MRKGTGIVALLAGCLAAAAAGSAAAQDKGWYLGGQGGRAQFLTVCDHVAGVCDDRDWAFRTYLGYQFNKYLALEAAYADMGEARLSGPDPLGGTIDKKIGAYGFDVLAVVTLPIGERLNLVGKVGAHRIRTTFEDKVTGTRSGETGSGYAYGGGLGYDLGKIRLLAEFLRYDNVGGHTIPEDSIVLYSLGVLFRFY